MGQNAILQHLIALERHVKQQDETILRMGRGLAAMATLAGAEAHIAKIVNADLDNPANPVPDPPAEGPTETTEEALAGNSSTPVKNDQPAGGNSEQVLFTPGTVPGSTVEVPADAVTTVSASQKQAIEEVLPPTAPASVDVTKPVAGTEGPRPLEEVKIEHEVVAEEGTNDVAFPLQGDFTQQQKTTGRFVASLRLARLRVAAGLADGVNDDVIVAQAIADDATMTNEVIAHEITTLERVHTASASKPAQEARGLVPRLAAVPDAAPRVASFRTEQPADQNGPMHVLGSYGGGAVTADECAFE